MSLGTVAPARFGRPLREFLDTEAASGAVLLLAAFAALVTRMDRTVGRLMEKLKALALDKNTLVLFTSDSARTKRAAPTPRSSRAPAPSAG